MQRFPDALAKTVPIWCAVLNSASALRHGTPTDDAPLTVPTDVVSASERAQIEARIPAWVDTLLRSDWAIPVLTKPLVPVFVDPSARGGLPPNAAAVHLLVLASASAVDPVPGQNGAHYVQGAGDDHESWAQGLTPHLFWQHRTELLARGQNRAEQAACIAHILEKERHRVPWLGGPEQDVTWIGATHLALAARAPNADLSKERKTYGLVVHCTQAPTDAPHVLQLGIPDGKRGAVEFGHALPQAIVGRGTHQDAITQALQSSAHGVFLCCTDGCHASGALAVAVLAASFDEHRALIPTDDARSVHRAQLTKDAVRRRLQWVLTASPHLAPSRAYLQRVNACLLGPQRQVR